MKVIYLLVLALLVYSTFSIFCKPYCDILTSCSASTYSSCSSGCQASTPYIFNNPGCSLNTTLNTLITEQLTSEATFTPSGYSTNVGSLASISCAGGGFTYHMLGPLGDEQYIYKEFRGLGTNHFKVDVFWSYGLFGSWANQPLTYTFIDGIGTTMQISNGQTCTPSTAFATCGTPGCFINYKQTITHSTDFLSVNFSSIASALPVGKTWAVKDLIIVTSLCHSTCLTCSGAAFYQCITCISGLYLQGSTCITKCPLYAMADTRACVSACPTYYLLNTYNNYCEMCPSTCQACSSGSECLKWDNGVITYDIVIQLLPLWITLAIILFVILAVITWKCCCSSKTFYDQMQEEVIDYRNNHPKKSEEIQNTKERVKDGNQSYETMEQRWLSDIDDLHMTKGTMKKNSAIQGIGKTAIK